MRPLRLALPLAPLATAVLGAWACACASPPTRTTSPGESVGHAATATAGASSSSASSSVNTIVIDQVLLDQMMAEPLASASASASASAAPPPGIAIGPGTRIFLFGDSMVTAGLGQRFETLAKARGAKYADNHWSSSTTKTWSESERLPNLLFKNKPDVVFIAIGSNEVYFLDKHADEHIKTIVKKLGGKPCVWIGPPVWKKQTGIVEAERDNASPCAFFDSSTLQLDRQPDGIHPSLKGGAQWAEAVWSATVAP